MKRQVKKGGPTVTELYDLTGDRGETKDLSSERPKLLRELSRMLDEWEKETAPENNKLSDA